MDFEVKPLDNPALDARLRSMSDADLARTLEFQMTMMDSALERHGGNAIHPEVITMRRSMSSIQKAIGERQGPQL